MGDYLFDKYRKELESELKFIEEQVKTLQERANEIRELITPKIDDEVDYNPVKEEEENLDIEEDEAKTEDVVKVEEKTINPIGFDINQPAITSVAPIAEQQIVSGSVKSQEPIVSQTPSQKVETSSQKGLLNLRENLNEYPNSIDLVDPSKTVDSKKKSPFVKPQFNSFNDIEIEIVDPRAQANKKSVTVEPTTNNLNMQQPTLAFDNAQASSGIMPGQSFTDNANQNPPIV